MGFTEVVPEAGPPTQKTSAAYDKKRIEQCIQHIKLLSCFFMIIAAICLASIGVLSWHIVKSVPYQEVVTQNELNADTAKANNWLKMESKNSSADFSSLQATVKNHEEAIKDLESKFKEHAGIGATYIRWGRPECQENDSEIVYSGYIGGSYYNHPGAASNHLCLPNEPQYDNYNGTFQSEGRVYGAEFDTEHSETFFGKDLRYHVPPCAVCKSIRTSVVMIPARSTCYDGWTKEFGGYLVSGHYNHNASTEYICVDKNATFTKWSNPAKLFGRRLYMVEGICHNNLKCPPYQDQKELTCVVCSR